MLRAIEGPIEVISSLSISGKFDTDYHRELFLCIPLCIESKDVCLSVHDEGRNKVIVQVVMTGVLDRFFIEIFLAFRKSEYSLFDF